MATSSAISECFVHTLHAILVLESGSITTAVYLWPSDYLAATTKRAFLSLLKEWSKASTLAFLRPRS